MRAKPLGNLRHALSDAPSHERVWAQGADGEERLAGFLAKRVRDGVIVLHDRRMRRGGNIDHLAVASSGVWVIDAKAYKGKQVRVHEPFFGDAKLLVGGRDRTKLVDGIERQVEAVRAAVGDVPVHGVLCFVDGELPILRTLTIRNQQLLYARRLAKRLNAPGPLQPADVRVLAQRLAQRFPAA